MTHITEPRAIGNHADMGSIDPKDNKKSDDSYTALTVTDVLRAGVRRSRRRRVVTDAESTWNSEGGAITP
ncbi:hypothetical protein [Mycolicibacterium wolinskyi]|uniref:hypothetical protein n=1 Tax=Mycolicibacterium wolinskyi TaxID=59750 RepID=UPI000B11C330|nr:hypothetical protein [Mycolicibacterium wolinskyi]